MTVLELLARSAGAGIVAAGVAPCCRIAFNETFKRGASGCVGGAAGGCGLELALCGGLLGLQLADQLLLLLGAERLDAGQFALVKS